MEHTKGLWEVVESKDESCDKPYFDYRIRAYPYGYEAGPQPVCLEILNKGDAHHICRCVNCHDALLAACKRALVNYGNTGNLTEAQLDSVEALSVIIAAAESED